MRFTFIHAADLHLGSPFIGLASNDEELAKRVATASREALEALVDYAILQKVAFVLIAGDVYDVDWRDMTIGHFFNREMSRLHREDIPVFLIKGNHDAESVITKNLPLPANVKSYSATEAHTEEISSLRVAIHGRSFPNRAVTENLAQSYPLPKSGWFNIGVLHTSCTGRPDHENYAPCSVDDLLQREYDYWALGHVHTFEQLHTAPPIVFSGNLQGRNIRETGPKGAVLVSVEDGNVESVQHLPFDQVRWAALSIDVSDLTTETDVLEAFGDSLQLALDSAPGIFLVYRATFHGATNLHRPWHADPEKLRNDLEATAAHRTANAAMESLRLNTSEPIAVTAEADAGLMTLDLGTMMLPLLSSPDVKQEATDALAALRSKFPAVIPPDALFGPDSLQRLLHEARESLLNAEVI